MDVNGKNDFWISYLTNVKLWKLWQKILDREQEAGAWIELVEKNDKRKTHKTAVL